MSNFKNLENSIQKSFSIFNDHVPKWHKIQQPLDGTLQDIRNLMEECEKLENKLKEYNCNECCLNCSSQDFSEKLGIASNTGKSVEVVEDSQTNHRDKNCEKQDSENLDNLSSNNSVFIHPMNHQEFNSIPKYMLGRFTFDSLNEIISKIDEFLIKKHHIFTKPNKTLTRAEKELLSKWKEMEEKSKKVKTNHFFVEGDIRPLIQEKLRPSLIKSIPCLRHIRRIREERCGPLTFYYP